MAGLHRGWFSLSGRSAVGAVAQLGLQECVPGLGTRKKPFLNSAEQRFRRSRSASREQICAVLGHPRRQDPGVDPCGALPSPQFKPHHPAARSKGGTASGMTRSQRDQEALAGAVKLLGTLGPGRSSVGSRDQKVAAQSAHPRVRPPGVRPFWVPRASGSPRHQLALSLSPLGHAQSLPSTSGLVWNSHPGPGAIYTGLGGF